MRWNHLQSVKEVARHAAFRLGAQNTMIKVRKRGGARIADGLADLPPADRFRNIYRSGTWLHAPDQESRSGLGSGLRATQNVRRQLPDLLTRLECNTLLDVGCGGWTWMRQVDLPCLYIGVDIVPEVVAANRRHEHPGVVFAVADATRGPLPKADVALCREILFHLSFDDARAALANVAKAADWLCATTDTDLWFNSDIATGDFRMVNLRRPPFSFPPPTHTITDDAISPGRQLAVWPTGILRKP